MRLRQRAQSWSWAWTSRSWTIDLYARVVREELGVGRGKLEDIGAEMRVAGKRPGSAGGCGRETASLVGDEITAGNDLSYGTLRGEG